MKKKLYKVKKRWVIGVITGSMLMFGCVASASADINAPLNPSDVISKINNDHEIKYDKDYNRYKSIDAYSDNINNRDAQSYVESLGKPTLVTYSDNQAYNHSDQTKVEHFEDINGQDSDMSLEMDGGSLQYHFAYTGDNKNYQSASATSSAVSTQSDNAIYKGVFTYHDFPRGRLSKKQYRKELKEYNTHDLFDNGKLIHSVYAKDDNAFNVTQNIVKSSGVAQRNAPKITYDKHNVLSFLQSTLEGHGYTNYSFDYTNSLYGYVFENGKQLQLSDLINSKKLVNKYLRGIAHKFNMLYAVDKKTGLVMSANDFEKGYSSFYLTKNGVFVFMPLQSGMSNWQNAVAVRLPYALINDKYMYLFGSGINGTVDVSRDNETFEEKGLESAGIGDLGFGANNGIAKSLKNDKEAKKIANAITDNPTKLSKLALSISNGGFGFSAMTTLIATIGDYIKDFAGSAIKSSSIMGALNIGDLVSQGVNAIKDFSDSSDNLQMYAKKYDKKKTNGNKSSRVKNFRKVRNQQMSGISGAFGFIVGAIAKAPALAAVAGAATALAAFVITFITKYVWNSIFAGKMSEAFGLKIKNATKGLFKGK